MYESNVTFLTLVRGQEYHHRTTPSHGGSPRYLGEICCVPVVDIGASNTGHHYPHLPFVFPANTRTATQAGYDSRLSVAPIIRRSRTTLIRAVGVCGFLPTPTNSSPLQTTIHMRLGRWYLHPGLWDRRIIAQPKAPPTFPNHSHETPNPRTLMSPATPYAYFGDAHPQLSQLAEETPMATKNIIQPPCSRQETPRR